MSGSTTRVLHLLGYTRQGQKLSLSGTPDANGRFSWSIHRDSGGRADKPVVLDGLDGTTIQKIADLVREDGR